MPNALASSRWPRGAQCAVSLCYDGNDPGHQELALPMLRRYGLRASFFLPPVTLVEHAVLWKQAADEGHELGSHCLFGYALADGSLPNWTLAMVEADLQMASKLIAELGGGPPSTFAYPGLETTCSEGDYRESVALAHPFGRSAQTGLNHPVFCDPAYLRTTRADGDGATVHAALDEALETGGWALVVIEGIGWGDRGIDAYAHRDLLARVAEDARIWSAPVRNVGEYAALQRAAARA